MIIRIIGGGAYKTRDCLKHGDGDSLNQKVKKSAENNLFIVLNRKI